MKLKHRSVPSWHRDVRELRKQGMTYQQIADRLFISTASVGSVIRADKQRKERWNEWLADHNQRRIEREKSNV